MASARAGPPACQPGTRISGIYERPIITPTGKLALIRREGTFSLAYAGAAARTGGDWGSWDLDH